MAGRGARKSSELPQELQSILRGSGGLALGQVAVITDVCLTETPPSPGAPALPLSSSRTSVTAVGQGSTNSGSAVLNTLPRCTSTSTQPARRQAGPRRQAVRCRVCVGGRDGTQVAQHNAGSAVARSCLHTWHSTQRLDDHPFVLRALLALLLLLLYIVTRRRQEP